MFVYVEIFMYIAQCIYIYIYVCSDMSIVLCILYYNASIYIYICICHMRIIVLIAESQCWQLRRLPKYGSLNGCVCIDMHSYKKNINM